MFLNVIFHVYVVPRRSCQLQHVHCNYELHLSYATQILAIFAVTKTTYGGSDAYATSPGRPSGVDHTNGGERRTNPTVSHATRILQYHASMLTLQNSVNITSTFGCHGCDDTTEFRVVPPSTIDACRSNTHHTKPFLSLVFVHV